jgi:hypothetical protein
VNKPLPKDVIVHNGLLFRMLSVHESDDLARSYGLAYAEQLVREIDAQRPQSMKLRPEVLAIALMMEQRLRDKDADKGQSWKDEDIGNLQVCTAAHVYRIENAIHVGAHRAAAMIAVDLANYCMFIADVGGVLQLPASEPESTEEHY